MAALKASVMVLLLKEVDEKGFEQRNCVFVIEV